MLARRPLLLGRNRVVGESTASWRPLLWFILRMFGRLYLLYIGCMMLASSEAMVTGHQTSSGGEARIRTVGWQTCVFALGVSAAGRHWPVNGLVSASSETTVWRGRRRGTMVVDQDSVAIIVASVMLETASTERAKLQGWRWGFSRTSSSLGTLHSAWATGAGPP